MAVYINPQNKKLTFELSDDSFIEQADRYKRLYTSLLDLLRMQDDNFLNQNTNSEILNFLIEIFPTDEQVERMLSEPQLMTQEIQELKREKHELSEQLRLSKEKQAHLEKPFNSSYPIKKPVTPTTKKA